MIHPILYSVLVFISRWSLARSRTVVSLHARTAYTAASYSKLQGQTLGPSFRRPDYPQAHPSSKPGFTDPLQKAIDADLRVADDLEASSFLQLSLSATDHVTPAHASAANDTAESQESLAEAESTPAAGVARAVHVAAVNGTAENENATAMRSQADANWPMVLPAARRGAQKRVATEIKSRVEGELKTESSQHGNHRLLLSQRSRRVAGIGFFSGVWDVFDTIVDSLKTAGTEIGIWVLGTLGQLPEEKPAKLGGHSRSYCNWAFVIMVSALLGAALIGYLLDCFIFPVSSKGRAGAAVILTICVSYMLLIPAIFGVLFSFNLFGDFEIYGAEVRYNLTRNKKDKPASITESMWDLISVLYDTGGYLGCVLVITYAILVPASKLVLLLIGECWRNSEDESRVLRARRCIGFVQMISKWASPDMFAYIMIFHLFQGLNNPPKLLANVVLDIGFIAFSLFCISSTISTLGITLPTLPNASASNASKSKPVFAWAGRGTFVQVSVLTVGFFALFFVGINMPCMSVDLNMDALLTDVPAAFEEEVEKLGLADLVDTKVSLWNCIGALLTEDMMGDATLIMAFILLFVFGVFLPLIDVVLILLVACGSCAPLDEEACDEVGDEETPKPKRNYMLDAASFLKHICMLDVFIMGVVVVCCAGAPYAEQGVAFHLEMGMIPLVCAEVLHYAAFHIVATANAHE